MVKKAKNPPNQFLERTFTVHGPFIQYDSINICDMEAGALTATY